MTRIIAGTAGGRRLAVPPGQGTRPTSDRAREGLFATVTAIRGTLQGAAVLDLYAGSGAVGLEALSRGAADVLLVESDARAARVIRGNIAALGLAGARVLAGRVERVLARGPGTGPPRDVVFADPPYATADAEVQPCSPRCWPAAGWRPGAVVAVERATRSGPQLARRVRGGPGPQIRRGDALVRSRRRRGACAGRPRAPARAE